MNSKISFKTKFFTKQKLIGVSRFLLVSLSICTIMAGIECTCIYAIETTRFDKAINPSTGKMIGMSGGVGGRDYGIALAIAGPLSGMLTTSIPYLGIKYFFKPMEAKHGEPKLGQKIMGHVFVTFSICFAESLIMSLIMYSIDTRVVLPKYMNPIFHEAGLPINFPTDGVGYKGARIGGVAMGICLPVALVVTAVIPMAYKKLFAFIDNKSLVRTDMTYNETDLAGKEEYLDDQNDSPLTNVKHSKKH